MAGDIRMKDTPSYDKCNINKMLDCKKALSNTSAAPLGTALDSKDDDPAWSRRYTEAAGRYEGLDLGSRDAVKAVIEGLSEWVRLVPQRSIAADGTPESANKWGLGAERCVLRAINSQLVAVGQTSVATRIRSEMADLLETAESLDECCMQTLPNPHAEKRLVATAHIQTKAMITLLSNLAADGARSSARTVGRRRGAPCRRNPAQDRRLMEEWAQVRGKAGMTRKEFCTAKGIPLRSFIQAQDRFRKQTAQA